MQMNSVGARSGPAIIRSEQLAYWYLRLNGFLTIPNFVVHPDTGGHQRTDVDILGVRLPYRAELLVNPMPDDRPFTDVEDRPYLIIAEVKSGQCNLNGPWTDPDQQNMHRVLRAVGAFPKDEVPMVAASLYQRGVFDNHMYHVSLMCFGENANPELRQRYPDVPQTLWRDVLAFIYDRFHRYTRQKASHPQWDEAGQSLWSSFHRAKDTTHFQRGLVIQG